MNDTAGRGEAAVRDAFHAQAGFCDRLGSPFTARLMRHLADGLDRSTLVGRTVLEWPGQPDAAHDALPLRLAGGLHALVRRGSLPELARLYPPNPPPADDVFRDVVRGAVSAGGDELAAWLASPPQTNEVARSAVLMAGYAVVAARTGMPLDLLELGASAGLNLLADRWAITLDGRRYGDAASPVRLEPRWTGPPPPSVAVRIAARRGVDRNPLDVGSATDRERMLAYIWPDQTDRLDRTKAAITTAQADPPAVDRDDAADWLERRLADPAQAGTARVVAHSIVLQYVPDGTRKRIIDLIEAVGATATAETPIGWLRFEADPGVARQPSIRLRLWPHGSDELLGFAHPHAASVDWKAG